MPLVQIIGAVALLVTGVLNLVAQLLGGLGLGKLLEGAMGKLGLSSITKMLGMGDGKGGGILGSITSSVFGTVSIHDW